VILRIPGRPAVVDVSVRFLSHAIIVTLVHRSRLYAD
jgi:hypothetical protein